MLQSKYVIFVFLGLIILVSGCAGNQEADEPDTQVSPTPADEQDKIEEFENKINSMQQQIDELQTRMDRVDLLEPSNNNLIPEVPFRIRVDLGEMEYPTTYIFAENGEVEILRADDSEKARYELFRENNTIKITSNVRVIPGLVLYDEYIAGIYENGWIAWVYRYQVTPMEKED